MKSNITIKRQYLILSLWIIFTILAFSYFINAQLINFDANKKLDNINHNELSTYFSAYIDDKEIGGKQTIIHFSKPNCSCQQYSKQHMKDIDKLAFENDFNIKNIIINKDTIIPSTPSVAIINKIGEVMYFGPYGQGIACSQTSGYAQTILNNHLKGYTANIIIKEAKGCYCAV
ncbi:DUF6436 domain-containing protein [Thalassotalea profundi]|uniref:DUF6436 domain-containing protein n=1 Tax=Thalassotalea profundi TaxID=2036687 RepID=A0ABQ3IHI1_9GAMM|nr:DUF6436 domain-containing protein [Thalassotalea profundi]GHE81546.1 hypothetical protein GCM10011501_07220 [Thalassotalea profundi]